MKKVRCVRGHFYDADASTLCPHCGSQEAKIGMTEDIEVGELSETKKKKFSFFGKGKTEKGMKPIDPTELLDSFSGSVDLIQSERKTGSGDESDPLKTRSILEFEDDDADVEEVQPKTANGNVAASERGQYRDIDSVKTVSRYGMGGTEPVTGWLVCVKGNNYGKAFEIKSGQNSIGRDKSMGICIMEEDITREKHAFVIFDPKNRAFFLRGGEGYGLTYCNEELVTSMIRLKAYDEIQLSSAKFLFIPFCGEQFMWEEQ